MHKAFQSVHGKCVVCKTHIFGTNIHVHFNSIFQELFELFLTDLPIYKDQIKSLELFL